MALALGHFGGGDVEDPWGLFNVLAGPNRGGAMRKISVDVVEKDKSWELLADIPGVRKEDITVRAPSRRLSQELRSSACVP